MQQHGICVVGLRTTMNKLNISHLWMNRIEISVKRTCKYKLKQRCLTNTVYCCVCVLNTHEHRKLTYNLEGFRPQNSLSRTNPQTALTPIYFLIFFFLALIELNSGGLGKGASSFQHTNSPRPNLRSCVRLIHKKVRAFLFHSFSADHSHTSKRLALSYAALQIGT
jgi:hypothetical protein